MIGSSSIELGVNGDIMSRTCNGPSRGWSMNIFLSFIVGNVVAIFGAPSHHPHHFIVYIGLPSL
jgi:hypothetical protein